MRRIIYLARETLSLGLEMMYGRWWREEEESDFTDKEEIPDRLPYAWTTPKQ